MYSSVQMFEITKKCLCLWQNGIDPEVMLACRFFSDFMVNLILQTLNRVEFWGLCQPGHQRQYFSCLFLHQTGFAYLRSFIWLFFLLHNEICIMEALATQDVMSDMHSAYALCTYSTIPPCFIECVKHTSSILLLTLDAKYVRFFNPDTSN